MVALLQQSITAAPKTVQHCHVIYYLGACVLCLHPPVPIQPQPKHADENLSQAVSFLHSCSTMSLSLWETREKIAPLARSHSTTTLLLQKSATCGC